MKRNKNKGKPFDKCFVDADSLIFRIALKDITLKVAKEYYDQAIEEIVWNTNSSNVAVALKGKGNFRYEVSPDYKLHRSGKPLDEAVAKRRKALNKYAYSLGHFKSNNCEADDVVSIWAQEALDAGENFVIAHIDKDIDMVEGWHYNFTKEWEEAHPEDWQDRLEVCWNLLYMRRNWDGFRRLTIEDELNDKV